MAERFKLLYIIVEDESDCDRAHKNNLISNKDDDSKELFKRTKYCFFRYTRPVLQSTLQLIGCKTRHAFKISKRVFEVLRNEIKVKVVEKNGSDFSRHDFSQHLSDSEIDNNREYSHEDIKRAAEENQIGLKEITRKLFSVQKRRSTIILSREDFFDVVCDAMSEYRYVGANQRSDFVLACKIRERKESVTILLCGTSGCGKSTLSTLLASRLGITTVVSTDSIRHMMRSFADENQNPLLWASTYSAGEHLDPKAVAEAKARKKAKKGNLDSCFDGSCTSSKLPIGVLQFNGTAQLLSESKGKGALGDDGVSSKMMAVQGYKAQSEMVIDSLDRLITSWEQKCESVIVEGVHLSLNFMMALMKRHPSIIPFMLYIANEEKHLERFAVRAKYMTLDPAKNKYVKYIRNIRAIQDYQCKRADKHLIPKVNNTNMDGSVASIHATIFACLRRREGGESFYDHTTNTVKMVDEEYRNQCAANSIGSKGMLQILRRRGSSRQLMALLNTDGSVAKAWPIDSGKDSALVGDMGSSSTNKYAMEKSPVNLQFGNFGLSAWPNDIGGPSHNGSIDGLSLRGYGTEYQCSQHGSSCSSSPRPVEGTEKELVNEDPVSGSDEEQEEDAVDADSEEETEHGRHQLEDELEGSVDDRSIASEEEEEDVDDDAGAGQDGHLDEKKLDSLGWERSFYQASLEGVLKPHKQFHQDIAGVVKECHKKSLLSNMINSHPHFWAGNEKHMHGRSKSLPPIFGNYISSFLDSTVIVEIGRRV